MNQVMRRGALKAACVSLLWMMCLPISRAAGIDGNLASESPSMRPGQEPWRFDVRIPEGSRLINLVVTDAGGRSPLDLADWVDAGIHATVTY